MLIIHGIQHTLDYFKEEEYLNHIHVYLKDKLFNLLPKLEDFKRKMWKVEMVFEFIKDHLKSKSVHVYTKKSVYKHVFFLNVLLMGLIVNKGYGKIVRLKGLQSL
jgi:hypothetical protein